MRSMDVTAVRDAEHAAALSWLDGLAGRVKLVWACDGAPGEPPANGRPIRLRRSARADLERRAALTVVERLLPPAERKVWITHSPLGRPILRMVPPTPGMRVSFSHEHGAHLCLASADPRILRVGIDAVWLPRLRRRGAEYLRLLARRFMEPAELAAFQAETARAEGDDLLVPLAARFSLMEAASKALGTGLRLGVGIGRPGALDRLEISAPCLDPVEIRLGSAARTRMRGIRGRTMEGHYGWDAEYLVSAAIVER